MGWGLWTVHALIIFERVWIVKLSNCHLRIASDFDVGLLKRAFKGKYKYYLMKNHFPCSFLLFLGPLRGKGSVKQILKNKNLINLLYAYLDVLK